MKNNVMAKMVSGVKSGKKAVWTCVSGVVLSASLFGAPLSAMAADQVFTGDGSADIEVSATVASGYTVKLPAALELKDNDGDGYFEASGEVGVKGNIASDSCILVVPSSGEKNGEDYTQETKDEIADCVDKVESGYIAANGSVGDEFGIAITYKNRKNTSKTLIGTVGQQYVRFRSSHENGALKRGDARLSADYDEYTNSYVNVGLSVDEPGVYDGLIVYTYKLAELK